MKTVWTIIPIKQLTKSKQRLSLVLTAGERADLMLALLENLLRVLSEVPAIDRVLVVTADERAAEAALMAGASVLPEQQPYSLNGAIRQAAAYATDNGADSVLILPADLPFVRPEDVRQMLLPLESETAPLAAICSDEAGDGTNGLLLAPPNGFAFHFGPASYGKHLIEAASLGWETVPVRASGLRFDLDNEADWLLYTERPVSR